VDGEPGDARTEVTRYLKAHKFKTSEGKEWKTYNYLLTTLGVSRGTF